VVLGIAGYDYYLTPLSLRAFEPDHDAMKPSGTYSHELGIAGTALVVVGVATYSTRKRMRSLWRVGNLSTWLQFHIAVCLLGPILVIFHTTFKAGGVAAISLWTMLSVWLSGMVGRFLYVQIPRNLQGQELTGEQVKKELDRISAELAQTPIGVEIAKQIDRRFQSITPPRTISGTVQSLFRLRTARRELGHITKAVIARAHLSAQDGEKLSRATGARIAMMQKSIVLVQVERLFHYWHVIHLPFTIIMFLTLAAHIVVAALMGYSWSF
jgi:hypothetical protein